MPNVIAVMNMKGGVGKTTVAVQLAFDLARSHGKRVLLIDLDPQFNATTSLMTEAAYTSHLQGAGRKTVVDIFAQDDDDLSIVSLRLAAPAPPKLGDFVYTVPSSSGRLQLVPSRLELMTIARSQRRPDDAILRFLNSRCAHYDIVFLDCPPTISIYTQAAVVAADSVLVPTRADPLSVIGLPLLEEWLRAYSTLVGKSIKNLGIVFTMVRQTNLQRETMADVSAARPGQAFRQTIPLANAMAHAAGEGRPVLLTKPSSAVARDFRALTVELLQRI